MSFVSFFLTFFDLVRRDERKCNEMHLYYEIMAAQQRSQGGACLKACISFYCGRVIWSDLPCVQKGYHIKGGPLLRLHLKENGGYMRVFFSPFVLKRSCANNVTKEERQSEAWCFVSRLLFRCPAVCFCLGFSFISMCRSGIHAWHLELQLSLWRHFKYSFYHIL